VSKDDFSSKSKEQLAALATAFNILTAEEADAMSQAQLAKLLDKEQKKSDEAGKSSEKESPKTKAKSTAKKTSSKSSKKSEVKAEAKTDAKEEKKAEVAESSSVPSEEKTPAEKTSKTSKRTKKSKTEETVKAEDSVSEAVVAEKKAETSEKKDEASDKKTEAKKRGRKAKPETDSKEESSVKEEAPKQEEVKEEKKEESSSEKPVAEEKTASKNKRGRGKKGAKSEDKSSTEDAKKQEDTKEAKTEESSQAESSESSSTNAPEAENKPENKEGNKKEDRSGQQKNKKQKSRHRSVEIRPAGSAPASSENTDENGEEKAAAEGETPAETQKPQIEPVAFSGVLEIVSDGGYGFVRRENYLPSPQDIFVPNNLIRRFGLRMGDKIDGFAFPKKNQDKNLALSYITTVNDVELDKLGRRPHFERLTPIYPNERFRLETGKQELSTRIIDLVSPIGKGQRGMIVSPPKAGKTILLQKIANAISQNSPKTKLIVLLIDERPEEVTDMQRSIKGEVVYSTFDKKPENHTRVTELVLERAMRLVEMGEDVVILLDSMTRLARAYNLTITPTGRTLSGGLDPGSLYGPKRFFGAARNIENGGSLTIVATSLIETGSRMDEVIFEEFKGTGNMEVYLDRKLSEKRIFPAIDINKSGTRREDLLMTQEELDAVWTIRKAFSQMETAPVTETIINLLLRTNSNDHFIRSVKVSFADKEVFDAMRGTGSQNNSGKD